jgi:hypothetical protein
MALNGVLIGIFVICLAFLWNEGFWSNTLTLINVLLAGLVATNWFETAADFLETKLPTYTYLLDFLAFWLLFFLSYTVLRAFTDAISKTRIRFKMPIEKTGGIVSCCAVGWLMICLCLFSLHLSPLARTAFRGGFQAEPFSNNFLGLAPDRMWLGFVQSRSQGALSKSTPEPFDPNGELIFKYGSRRERFSKELEVRVKR